MEQEEGKRIALVTGGSRGIGRAVCIELAARGAYVYVNYAARSDAAMETVAMCEEVGGSAEALPFDVGESAAVEEAINLIKEKSGRLDILVNNAGITGDAIFVRMKDDTWRDVLRVNLDGAFYCSRAAAKLMIRSRFGRIINMSSVVGEMGNPGQAAYAASKAGLIGLTKTLAKELASRGVTVNAIAPGFIETDMTSALDEKVRASHMGSIPLGRYGSAEEIAFAVAFLTANEAGYITGQVLGINGGMYL